MLVVVLTTEKMFDTRGKAVRDTWMDYANNKHPELGVHVVMAYDGKPTKDTEGVPMIPTFTTSYDDLYLKVIDVFETIRELYGDDYDYFMKADDDVFVHVDRLAARFSKVEVYNPAKSQVFGFRGPGDFMCWGGPGYLMSRQALREIYPHMVQCGKDFILPEDITIAWCFMRHSFNHHKKIWLGCQPLENNDHTGFCHIPPPQKENWALWDQPDKEFEVEGTWIKTWRFSTVLTMHAFKTELNTKPSMREYYNHFYNNDNH
ncbi:hypothetical protein EDD21DRAFT_366963 [Dissophora ornata]|nr:hypothetical protein EDD21DRAFT_366963 [Dissophora ornata]